MLQFIIHCKSATVIQNVNENIHSSSQSQNIGPIPIDEYISYKT